MNINISRKHHCHYCYSPLLFSQLGQFYVAENITRNSQAKKSNSNLLFEFLSNFQSHLSKLDTHISLPVARGSTKRNKKIVS